jgi:hypothetical protein
MTLIGLLLRSMVGPEPFYCRNSYHHSLITTRKNPLSALTEAKSSGSLCQEVKPLEVI